MKKVTKNNFKEFLQLDEIEGIHFFKINFSFQNFSDKNFVNCTFEKCNFSNTILKETTLNHITFINSKLMGVRFNEIKTILSHFNFFECDINLCYFNGLNLKNISFEKSKVLESEFYGTILESVNFTFCDLKGSIFEKTNLKKAIFTGAINYIIDPNINFFYKTKFSKDNIIGLLDNLDIIIE